MTLRTPANRVSWGARLGDALLTVLAIAGSLCLILVVLGYFFNISIMMFRTGSMSPTIEAGSIALVREVPARELREGDVVTVERGTDLLPVTHRVLQIHSVDEQTGVATFTMKGDANETPDPMPYSVDTVREVLFSVPGIAPAIQWFSNPLVLGGLTVSASALVVWAFWPREPKAVGEPSNVNNALTVLPLLLLLAPLGLPVAQNGEAHVEDIRGEILQMRSISYPQTMQNLSPGDSATWVVDVWAETSEPGTVEIALAATTATAHELADMEISVRTCNAATTMSALCTQGNTTTVVDTDLAHLRAQTAPVPIDEFTASERHRYLVTSTLGTDLSVASQGFSATLSLTATGYGEELTLTPEDEEPPQALPETGSAGLPWLVSVALLLLGVGAVIWRKSGEVKHAN